MGRVVSIRLDGPEQPTPNSYAPCPLSATAAALKELIALGWAGLGCGATRSHAM